MQGRFKCVTLQRSFPNSATFMFTRIDHVMICVPDLDKAIAQYHGTPFQKPEHFGITGGSGMVHAYL